MRKKLHAIICTLKSILFVLALSLCIGVQAQTTTNVIIPAGSFIINMGVMPQTVANGLKPYGLVYALLQAKCPVEWVINPAKTKDGADFRYNGVDYKGGTFIIKTEYRTPTINSLIALWQTYGVQGITTTSPVTVPVYLTFWSPPRWTMDLRNGGIATAFFANAGIPASAYGGASTYWKNPADLNCCDDIFVMPHADPIWATHRRLFDWVSSGGCKGGVWLGCHAGSALENMFDNITTDGDPIDPTQQTNFLSEKSGPAAGAGPYSTPGNSLILWGSHSDGTLPYTYNSTLAADPVGQFMGSTDAAQLNGSEQIYIPTPESAGWRPTTKVLVYDPDHPNAKVNAAGVLTHVGAVLVYGPGMGVPGNGKIFLEAGHNISGTAPANIAAQRAFFNYSFLVAWEKAVLPSLSNLPEKIYSGTNYELSYSAVPNLPPAPTQNYTTVWSASCGGTFTPNNTSPTVTYTPPTAATPTSCNISVTITDECGRSTFDTHTVMIECNLQVATTITNPCNGSANSGAIGMTFTNGSGPYNYTWTKTGGSATLTGSGTLSAAPYSITGLSAGTYTVTVTANSGKGCPATFTTTLSESPALNVTQTLLPPTCNGAANGAINITVSGGTPPYTYLWSDGGITTANRSGLAAGTYSLTVTDAKNCATTTSINLLQPAVLTAVPTVNPVTCFNAANGSITLAVSGGNIPYSYLWNDGVTTKDRTSLAAGTYSATITDAKGCIVTTGNISVNQPAAALSLTENHVNVLCSGNTTGLINLSVSGGTSPYNYTWTKTGTPGTYATTEDLSGLAVGTYSVLVTDKNGCISNLSVTITQPPALTLKTVAIQPTCPPAPPTNPAIPAKNSDGSIDLTVSGGTSPYTYTWTASGTGVIPAGQSTLQDLTALLAGTYTVVVKDVNNCEATTTVTLNYLNPNPVQPTSIKH